MTSLKLIQPFGVHSLDKSVADDEEEEEEEEVCDLKGGEEEVAVWARDHILGLE